MKKRIAILSALLIGAGSCLCGNIAWAGGASGDVLPAEENTKVENGTPAEEEYIEEEAKEQEAKDTASSEESAQIVTLQIPEKLEIILNPWEMDGQPQIYSEKYVVKNCGERPGTLLLSELKCEPEGEGVHVQTEKQGLHDGTEKSVYMELEFGNGEKLVLSEEASGYETRLEPGAEFAFWFSGEMNENASEQWEGKEVSVTAVYSWTAEEPEASEPKGESLDTEPEAAEPKASEPEEKPAKTGIGKPEDLKPAENPIETEPKMEKPEDLKPAAEVLNPLSEDGEQKGTGGEADGEPKEQ